MSETKPISISIHIGDYHIQYLPKGEALCVLNKNATDVLMSLGLHKDASPKQVLNCTYIVLDYVQELLDEH